MNITKSSISIEPKDDYQQFQKKEGKTAGGCSKRKALKSGPQ
jgi:hypothetical protein